MIEMTDEQASALESSNVIPARLINPRTQETFVLLKLEEYERLTDEYDDSPWTREELEGLAWEAADRGGWDEAIGGCETSEKK